MDENTDTNTTITPEDIDISQVAGSLKNMLDDDLDNLKNQTNS